MTNFPLISVIIPAHNNAMTIGAAIESMVKQTYPNLEIIVINDNSTDETKAVVQTLTKKYSNLFYYALPFDDPHRFNKRGRNVNAGYSARNYGFEKVRGEWITFQDADDASLLNRIEIQYEMAKKYDALHISTDWFQFSDKCLGKKLNIDLVPKNTPDFIVGKKEIKELSRKSKGIAMSLPNVLRSHIPFEIKRMCYVNKLFFGSLSPYPFAGNCPLFKREVIKLVKFRSVDERVWPTFVGRGADRDFDFQVAETFGNSIALKLPLYMWRVETENPQYKDGIGQFICN